ncbi:MAG TPA: ParB N-terminal domain-containing protein [Candidatus Kapabacteria bacterium]|nr:ParB N-terminal domain-containing protein [Candidatus Kapabacteria bacterium]
MSSSVNADMVIVYIDRERLHPDPFNEQTYGQIYLEPVFLDSILTYGIRQPLTVRPHPEIPGDYILCGGHRRMAAADEAEIAVLPCEVVEPASPAEIENLLVALNAQREKTTYQKVNEFRVLERNREGASVEEIAGIIGASYREGRRIHVIFGTRYQEATLRKLRLPKRTADMVSDCWEQIRTACVDESISLSTAEEKLNKLLGQYRGSNSPGHGTDAPKEEQEERASRGPLFRLSRLESGQTFIKLERFTSGLAEVDMGYVQGGVVPQFAFRTDQGMVVLTCDILLRKFVLPALKAGPVDAEQAEPE